MTKVPQVYTIETAAKAVGRTPQYVRHAIKSGALKSTLKPREGYKSGSYHEITAAALKAWRDNIGTRAGNRADGRTRYIVYLTPEEFQALPKNIQTNAKKAYKPKAKAKV